MSLTATQRNLLRFIERFQAENDGVSPSYGEMAAGIGLVSKSGIDSKLTALETHGYVRRLPGRPRSIEVLRSFGATTRAAADLTPDLLALLESTMWAASVEQEGEFAPGCSLCGAERPSDPLALCICRLGRTVQRARAAMLQQRRAAE